MDIEVQYFPDIVASTSNHDGQVLLLQVRREDGSQILLAFPHQAIPDLVGLISEQMDQGRDKDGEEITHAFMTSDFSIDDGPEDGLVLSIMLQPGGVIHFQLPSPEAERLRDALAQARMRN
jgi:hypothetical protein